MNHARRICLLLAVLFLLTAVFTACEPGADVGSGTGSGDVTGGNSGDKDKTKPNPYADDDTVYHAKCFAGDCVYFRNENARNRSYFTVFTLLDYPGDIYSACQDPTCYHSSSTDCPFVDTYPICVVEREGHLPIVFMGMRGSKDIRMFDSETGETRTVGELPQMIDTWFYRRKLYIYSDDDPIPGHLDKCMWSLDPVTKKSEYFDAGVGVSMLGIWRDRVWYMTDRNVICSCTLDFSDTREEYDVGINEEVYQFKGQILRGYIDGGMIYFERNRREPEKFPGDAFINSKDYDLDTTTLCDVYVLDADDIGAGERLVAEGVIQFKPQGGDLYYTKMDYDHYEESETYDYTAFEGSTFESIESGKTFRFDGGTLYRYEHESGEVVTVVEDCGTNFNAIRNNIVAYSYTGFFDITDDYVFFCGRQYRDLDDELKNRDCCNYMCQLDIKTGEWRVLVKEADVPLNQIF